MKRTVIFAFVLVSAVGAQAQNVKDLERAGFVRDSVAEVLAEHRANYARNESMRDLSREQRRKEMKEDRKIWEKWFEEEKKRHGK